MNREIQILLIVTAGVSSFSIHNSTPVISNENIFEPIIIPNITKYFERPQTTNTTGPVEEKDSGLRKPQLTTITENYSEEEAKVDRNPQRFSSRYSTKEKDRGRTEQTNGSASEVPYSVNENNSESGGGEPQEIEERRSFSDRSDGVDSSEEEEEDVRKYFDANEPQEWEVSPTTNEPSQDSARQTSFQSSPHPDFKNYEITSTSTSEEEEEDEEKNNSEEMEEKRSVDDYYNSGSKNYHSVQTPLSKIRYRGPHSFQDDFDSEKARPRLMGLIRRPHTGHNWPYSKAELEKENEISESDESSLEEGIRKELKAKPKITGLELAVKKDEKRFDEKRKYNYLEEKGREKQKVENLVDEEEKDHRRHPFHTLKQYQVDEEPRYQPSKKISPKLQLDEGPPSSKYPFTTTPRNIFKDKLKQDIKFDISQELAPAFQGHHFLGPVVFNPNGDQKVAKVSAKDLSKNANKGLLDREKLDQDNLTNERIHKSIFGTGSADYTATVFNHLEESEEMYNAILANIQSVFGLRTNTPKSNGGSSRFRPEESRPLTWSLPVKKDSQIV